jgi:hypothetical protein
VRLGLKWKDLRGLLKNTYRDHDCAAMQRGNSYRFKL